MTPGRTSEGVGVLCDIGGDSQVPPVEAECDDLDSSRVPLRTTLSYTPVFGSPKGTLPFRPVTPPHLHWSLIPQWSTTLVFTHKLYVSKGLVTSSFMSRNKILKIRDHTLEPIQCKGEIL